MTTERVNRARYVSLFRIRGLAFRPRSSPMSLNGSPKLMSLRRGCMAVQAWAWPFRNRSSSEWKEEYGWRASWAKEACSILRFISAFHKARVPLRRRLGLSGREAEPCWSVAMMGVAGSWKKHCNLGEQLSLRQEMKSRL